MVDFQNAGNFMPSDETATVTRIEDAYRFADKSPQYPHLLFVSL